MRVLRGANGRPGLIVGPEARGVRGFREAGAGAAGRRGGRKHNFCVLIVVKTAAAGRMAGPAMNPGQGGSMIDRLRAVAFDLDAASLSSLREALPGWAVHLVNGATAASLSPDWNPGPADLLVVNA